MRSTLPAILAGLGILWLAGCASAPAPSAANDLNPPQGAAPQPEAGGLTARMNGQYGWYGAVVGKAH